MARTNTIKTFLLVGICFIICWSNNQGYFLLYNLGYGIELKGTYFNFATLMAFGNCTVNPFIYLIKYKDYQNALREFLGFNKHLRSEDLSNNTTNTSTSVTTTT